MASNDFLLTRRSTLIGAATAAVAMPALGRTDQMRPNILFIMADDLGFADVSCYGRTDYSTPAIDSLAHDGLRFTSAYANSAVCTATRVALITGRYQYRLPIGLEEPLADRDLGVPPDHPTIGSLLRAQGYTTSLIGKWHLGNLPHYGPLKSGYDEFWGIRSGGVDYFTHKVFGQKDLWDGMTQIDQAGYLTDLLGERTISTLEKRKREGRPWFISLHFTAPHWPWEGPGDKAESDRLDAKQGPLPIMHFDGGSMAKYGEIVTRMDWQIGRILKALRRLGTERNTIVVFTSDNGGERFSKNWPFSGRKTELLEGGLRVPAIVRWPGMVKPGSMSDAQIMSMDWLPTLVGAAGGKPAPAYPSDGWDIRAAMMGRELPERTLFWRYKNMDQRAVRKGNWKYLKINENEFLFDVVADPMEMANLKDRKPEIFGELKQLYDEWSSRMLPLDPASFTHGYSAKQLADHFGVDD